MRFCIGAAISKRLVTYSSAAAYDHSARNSWSVTSTNPACCSMPARSPGLASRKIPGAVGSGGGSSTTLLIASIERPIEGFFSGADQTAAASQLPGFRTRAISAAAFGISGKNIRQKRLVTASNEFASNGSAVTSPVRNVTFARPNADALRRATASIGYEPVIQKCHLLVKESFPLL